MSYFNTIDKKFIQNANEPLEQTNYNQTVCYPQQEYDCPKQSYDCPQQTYDYNQQYNNYYSNQNNNNQNTYSNNNNQNTYSNNNNQNTYSNNNNQNTYSNQSYGQYQQQYNQYQQQYQKYQKYQQYLQQQQYQDQQNCQIPQIEIPYQKINVSKTHQEKANNKLNNLPSYSKHESNGKNLPNSPCIIKIEGDGNILSNNNHQLKHYKHINIEDNNNNNSKIEDCKIEDCNNSKIEISKIEDCKIEDCKIEDSKIEDSKIEDSKIEISKIEDSKIKIIKDNKIKIDDELLEAEYIVINKIYDDDILKYIKAINKNGQKVLINIDENNNDFNISKKRADKSDKLPYNIKTSALNCINNVVCGVALQCGNDEMCIINKNSKDLKIKETLYDYNGEDKNDDDLIVYPVIKLSEIKLNPKDLLVNTDVATARLQNMAYNTQLENLGTTSVELNKLNNNFNKFNILREEITDKLKTTLKQLKEINNKYNNDPQLIENNKDLYKQVQKNLSIREEKMMKLSNYIKKFADKKTHLENINIELDAIIDNCMKNFENIELVL
jgi:hypothetical protein